MQQSSKLQLDLLGRFRLIRDKEEIRLATGKAILVLAFLASARERTARRDRLASLFWSESDVEQARGSLRQTLSRLRSALGVSRDAIWSDNEQIGLTDDDWIIDIDALQTSDQQTAAHVNPSWAAEFLSGIHRRDPSIDAWLEGERQILQQTVSRVFTQAIEQALASGDSARALDLGGRLTSLDPFAEHAHCNLMLAYEQAGDRTSALRQYRTLVRVLDEGLGVAPNEQSRALYERLRQPAALSPNANPTRSSSSANSDASTRLKTSATRSQSLGMRLVTILCIRLDGIEQQADSNRLREAIMRQHGGEALLSHGAESLFVFGLDGVRDGNAEAAFRAALQVREPQVAGAAPACGCASGLISFSSDDQPVGSVIPRAARLALLSDSGDLIVDRAVLSQLSVSVQVEETILRDQISYRILNVQAAHTAASHNLFGRHRELTQLIGLLNDCTENRAVIAMVSGEAGIGKTHLMLSVERSARDSGGRVIRIGFGTQVVSPRSLSEQLLRSLRDELLVSGDVVQLDEVQQSVFGQWLDPRRSSTDAMTSVNDVEHLMELIGTMVTQLCTAGPLLLIAEDCHWAKAQDIELLIDVLDAHATLPIVLVATERRENEVFAPVLQTRITDVDVLSFTLTPLSRQYALRLVQSLVDDETTQQRILERAGGHPLFLTQLAAYDIAPDAPVPISVVALVQSELDRTPEHARDACLKAAVLGFNFTLNTLESLFPEIERMDLVNNRLFQEKGENLQFSHVLIHEAVYALLNTMEAERLHRLAAQYYKPLSPVQYAHHALLCGDDEMALDACCSAAFSLLFDNRHKDAEHFVERGFSLQPNEDFRARLLLSSAHLQRDRGELKAAVGNCQRAYDSATDPSLQVQALVRSATMLKRLGELDRSSRQLYAASEVASVQTIEPYILAELEHEWGNLCFLQGRAQECRLHHLRMKDYAEQADSDHMRAAALGGLGDAYYAEGKARSANRCFNECVELAGGHNLQLVRVAYRPMAIFTAHILDPALDNSDLLSQAIDDAQRWKSAHYEILTRLVAVEVLTHTMQIDYVEEQLQEIKSLQLRHGGDRYAADIEYGRLLMHWASGKFDLAGEIANEAVELYGNDTYLGPSLQAALAALSNSDNVADKALAKGEALLRQGSVIHNRIAYAHLGSACYWRRGQYDKACAMIERAQHQLGSEPVGLLDACLSWMAMEPCKKECKKRENGQERSESALPMLEVTHPRPNIISGSQGYSVGQ